MSGGDNPVVTRFYRESADCCAQAIRLLLDFKERKQMATEAGDHDNAEDLNNDRTHTKIIPE